MLYRSWVAYLFVFLLKKISNLPAAGRHGKIQQNPNNPINPNSNKKNPTN